MKIKQYSLLLTIIALVYNPVIAIKAHADIAKINTTMTANLTISGCTVSVDTKNKIIQMGDWQPSQFLIDHKTPPVHFSINLEDCDPTVTQADISFMGQTDLKNPSLLALTGSSSAHNVAIAILDKDKKLVPFNVAHAPYPLKKDKNTATIDFYTQYVATEDLVTPGDANADALFRIVYQ